MSLLRNRDEIDDEVIVIDVVLGDLCRHVCLGLFGRLCRVEIPGLVCQ